MSVSDPVPAELLANDLVLVLRGAIENNSHLLSPNEHQGVEEIVSLPNNSQRLLARLLERKGPAIRLDSVPYEDVGSPEEALAQLLQSGLAVELGHGWTRTQCFSMPELKALLRESGRPVSGKKADLVERVMDAGLSPVGRVIVLLVGDLVRRCEWLFFGVPGVRRKRFLLERIGRQRWMVYSTSCRRSPFSSREELLRYERIQRGDMGCAALIRELSNESPKADRTKPFSILRLLERKIEQIAAQQEQAGQKKTALELYRVLLFFRNQPSSRLERRVALCLEALGETEEGARFCQEAVEHHAAADSVGLSRTGRRLARKAGVSWRPSRPLLVAPERQVGLHSDARGWLGQGIPIERAVMTQMGSRRVAWREGGLWTTLFGLLCFDLLWEPAPGMLPAPCLPGPLDLGRPGFGVTREAAFRARLKTIESGEVTDLLETAFRHKGVRVKGLDWNIASAEEWGILIRSLPSKGLSCVLNRLATEGFRSANGLPDLMVWPGERSVLENGFPSTVQRNSLLVEIKGPSDQLREDQEGWHHRLLSWGFFVETWRVEELVRSHANYRRATSRTPTSGAERKQRASYVGPSPGGPLFDSWAGPDGL